MTNSEEIEEQAFILTVIRRIDKKKKIASYKIATKGKGIALSEAVIFVEGWANKIKEELQKPIVTGLKISPNCQKCGKVTEDLIIDREGNLVCKDCGEL